ncbi:MFP transporter [Vibrio sp. MACH09]|uniref:HlyD family secretion protein n=1 Tax=unclassified Vibrio TaxID=2614977 RepID=UPI001493A542|nr:MULTISPECIES: HlyD family secretion protein [unclassified Vibrio]NOI66782.1 HlyD family secretion protein [Vibrio sp. 99-8-1]GLO62835.1 MFP transporter [Vibrio sp. MACH09]
METLLVLTYTAFCVAIFKVFKIPLNKWTVPTAVLGGVALVGSMVLVMNYNHPFTHIGGQIFNTTPIVSSVRGKVVEVNVVANQPLKKGEVLFKIDPTPFEAEVVNRTAALVASQQNVLQLESVYKAAQATAIKATAERDKAQREYQRYQKGFSRGAFTEQQVDTKQQSYKAAQASLEAALANQNQAELAYTSEINGENTSVARAKAALTQAQFNLDETTVYAPTDGYVSQLALRPGMMAVPLPLAPVMTFVHTEDKYYVGAFRQNASQRLKPGFEADFIFRALPGKTFKGEVVELIPAIAEGQIQARGTLLGTNALNTQGRLMVKLRILDDISSFNLPLGSAAEIAVYSPHFEHVSVMRKILIRMKSWQNYLYVDH